jgi:hypothetical protein
MFLYFNSIAYPLIQKNGLILKNYQFLTKVKI